MRNAFTAIVERDGPWHIAYCPEIPRAHGQGRSRDRRTDGLRGALSAKMSETVTSQQFRVEGGQDWRAMSAPEQGMGGPAIEVAAKATRQRFTVEDKRRMVREADAGKTPGAV